MSELKNSVEMSFFGENNNQVFMRVYASAIRAGFRPPGSFRRLPTNDTVFPADWESYTGPVSGLAGWRPFRPESPATSANHVLSEREFTAEEKSFATLLKAYRSSPPGMWSAEQLHDQTALKAKQQGPTKERVEPTTFQSLRAHPHVHQLTGLAPGKLALGDLYRIIAAVEESNARFEAFWFRNFSNRLLSSVDNPTTICGYPNPTTICGYPAYYSDKVNEGEVFGGAFSELEGNCYPKHGAAFARLIFSAAQQTSESANDDLIKETFDEPKKVNFREFL